ncbi:MAG: acyl-CoA dehydrogenase family protein, partial [Bacteroidia bacterium]|nr:acyl-CoA dehydrogenase family protein [Bacteroidia bacterium]
GRLKLAAAAIGGAKRVSTAAVQYANQRHQFNLPLVKFGAIRHKLAEMAIRIYACESATYRASGDVTNLEHELLAQGKPLSEAILGAAEEYSVECAMMKVFGSETLDFVVDEGVQIYGGMGFSEEAPMARAYRDSRINRIFEGTNEINRMLTVDMLFKKAMRGDLDLMSPAMAVQSELMSIPDFGNQPEGILGAEKKALKNFKKAILMVAGAAAQKFMQQLAKEQEILMNIADMCIDTYVAESTLLRVEKMIATQGEEASSVYIDIAKVYLNDAADRINIAGKNAVTAFADGDMMRMMLMGIKRFTKVEPMNTKDARRRIAQKFIEANQYCF